MLRHPGACRRFIGTLRPPDSSNYVNPERSQRARGDSCVLGLHNLRIIAYYVDFDKKVRFIPDISSL